LIHTEMFKDLRDRPVVLADLSLENPNVFYELGIRHVMADSGTVLICREGATLPFDVALSRVVFYKFDGQNLDWEEVERVTPVVTAALKEAQRGKPDSPVHALLPGNALRSVVGSRKYRGASIPSRESEDLEAYERSIAESWLASSIEFEKLYAEHTRTIFGTRALGELCLVSETLPSLAAKVADLQPAEVALPINRGRRRSRACREQLSGSTGRASQGPRTRWIGPSRQIGTGLPHQPVALADARR
jgi:hypothetical protein